MPTDILIFGVLALAGTAALIVAVTSGDRSRRDRGTGDDRVARSGAEPRQRQRPRPDMRSRPGQQTTARRRPPRP